MSESFGCAFRGIVTLSLTCGLVLAPYGEAYAVRKKPTPTPIPTPVTAQIEPAATPLPGKSTEPPAEFQQNPANPFVYLPVDVDFWEEAQSLVKDGDYPALVKLGAHRVRKFDKSTPEGAEGYLATGIGLRGAGLIHGAFTSFVELAKGQIGTKIGEAALHELNQIAQSSIYDKEALEELIVSNEFAAVHEDIQSFISFHRALYHQRLGYKKWADSEFAKIKPESFWAQKLRYYAAIHELQNNNFEKALELFNQLRDDAVVPAPIREEAALQYARLIFEKGEFEEAFQVYNGLKLPFRERGRVMLERAWSRYYLKDYSKALGILESLEAPMFDPSRTFEHYILKMIIFRELCHYEKVEEAAGHFRRRFSRSLRLIKDRKDLRGDRVLASMALLDRRFQDSANFIAQLREELDLLKASGWRRLFFYGPMVRAYREKDSEIQTQIDMDLEPRARQVALELLDAEEQVAFLEYTSKLDALRIVRQGENRDYRSEKVSYLKFDNVYWPFMGEFWLDELDSYKVLISSRCGDTLSKPTLEEERFR